MIKDIEFTDNPKHGIVRKVRKLKDANVTMFISSFPEELEELTGKNSKFDIEDAIVHLMTTHPEEFAEFQEAEENSDMLSAISLATNKIWSIEDLDEYSFDDVTELYDKSLEMLGGSTNRFFKKSQSNIPEEAVKKTKTSPSKKKS